VPWYAQRSICFPTMEAASANARYAERHKEKPFHDGTFPTDLAAWSATRTPSHPFKYDEGVTIWAADTDVNPHDHFLGGADRCKQCSGHQSTDEPT
jgi:hypothetical protein